MGQDFRVKRLVERCWFVAFSVGFIACGGAEQKDLYGGSGGSSSATGGSTSGGSGGASGGVAGVASTGGSSGMSGGGGTTSDGGGASGSGGSSASGGTSASGGGGSGGSPSGGGGAGGAGGAASGVGVGPCGALTCAFSAGDACCKADNVPLYCSNEKVQNPCKCNGIACGTLELTCDGPEDCSAPSICCAEKGLISSDWDVVSCRESCKSDQPVGSTRREVCHPNGPLCASGTACKPDPLLPPGYHTCAP